MYCDVTDIEAYYNNVEFDCSDSYISNSEIISFIRQETAFINANLRKKYSLPLTDTDDQLLAKMVCEKLVVGTIDEIIREKSPIEGQERGRNYRKEGLDLLKQLSKGEITLNQTETTSCIKFNNTDSEGNIVEKQFKVADITSSGEALDRENRTIVRAS